MVGFLFAKAGHEQKIIERSVIERARAMEDRQFSILVDLHLLVDEAWTIPLSDQFRLTVFSACSMRHGNCLGFGFRRTAINSDLFLEIKIRRAAPVISRAPRLNVKS